MKKFLVLFCILAVSIVILLVKFNYVSIYNILNWNLINKLNFNVSNIKIAKHSNKTEILLNDNCRLHSNLIQNINNKQSVNVNNLLVKNIKALENEMIIYRAKKEKYVITVFTDITCIFCHKLHKQIKNYNALGITVRYLAFPHTGLKGKLEQDMRSIWCEKNRNRAFDRAMNGESIHSTSSCSINIANHYILGTQFGITGIPAIVLSNGYVILGYQEPNNIKNFLLKNFKEIS